MARSDLLRRMHYKSPLWFVMTPLITILFIVMMTVPLVAISQRYGGLEIAGSLGFGFLMLPLAAVLWAKLPALTPFVTDETNTFKPWAIRALWACLAAAFGLIAVSAFLGQSDGIEGSLAVGLVCSVFALIFAGVLFRDPGYPSSEPFGLIHPQSRRQQRRL